VFCCGSCRNVETPKSSHVSFVAHDRKTAHKDEVNPSQVTRDDEQSASVLSKYVDLLIVPNVLTHNCTSV